MEPLTNPQIRKLKALAQRMDPTTKVGRAGLSDGFLRSLDELLSLHEIVKVKFTEFKEEKKTLAPQLAEKTSSHLVMLVGNVAVVYRQNPDPEKRKVVF